VKALVRMPMAGGRGESDKPQGRPGQRGAAGKGARQPGIGSSAAGKWAVFVIVAIGVFMGTLDSSIVNISLPVIARNFGVPLSGAVEWVIIGYLVMNAAALLTAGRLSDMAGRRVVWLAGLVLFTGSSALCGAALSLWFLVAARLLQGLGGALLFSTSPALLITAFPARERGRALGYNAVTVALGTSAGPTLGGIITGYASWRWIFYLNVPVGILGIVLSALLLKEKATHRPSRFDPLGAALLGVGLASLVAALSFGAELGFASPLILGTGLLGLSCLGFVAYVEKRAPNPIIRLSLFRNRVFLSANLSLVLSFLALFAVSFLMPFYLEQLRAYPTQIAGLLLTPLPFMIALVAPISGRIADKTASTRWLASFGLLIACAGLVLLGLLKASSSMTDIVLRLLLVGFGQGLFQAPNNSALLGSAPPEQRGSASGFLATGRVIGQSMSVALAGAVFAGLGGAAAGTALQLSLGALAGLQGIFLRGFRAALFVCAGIALLGVFASLVRGREQGPEIAAKNPGQGGPRWK
jgi:EmrB/QacA subfamily drug resistance transporter